MAAASPTVPVSFDDFMRGHRRLLEQLIKEHAHGEVVIVFQDGVIRLVRVLRNFQPQVLAVPPPR